METFNTDIAEMFSRDLVRLSDEVSKIPDDYIWKPAPGITNSCGILAQHIIGNLNHYIGMGLGDTGYKRDRDLEFTNTGIEKSKLVRDLAKTATMVEEVLGNLDSNELSKPYQFYDSGDYTVRQFLIHVYGHLNYHLGQVNYLRRILTENNG